MQVEKRLSSLNLLYLNFKETEDYIPLPPTIFWWQSNDPRKCKCQNIREIAELFK